MHNCSRKISTGICYYGHSPVKSKSESYRNFSPFASTHQPEAHSTGFGLSPWQIDLAAGSRRDTGCDTLTNNVGARCTARSTIAAPTRIKQQQSTEVAAAVVVAHGELPQDRQHKMAPPSSKTPFNKYRISSCLGDQRLQNMSIPASITLAYHPC